MLAFSIPFPQSPICDAQGTINRDWYLFLTGVSASLGNGTQESINNVRSEAILKRLPEIDRLRTRVLELEQLVLAQSDKSAALRKMAQQIEDLQMLVLAQQRTNGASVSQNSRVANGRMDGP
jgi:hypothetical protein